ncbi:MAG: NADH-quinone oxidoreductase subunit [Actinomycetota bacterium]|jgi:NADH:ubiquinone oxidoreductase subunit C|nr:NADH-quinone oxidoreductase subunit [Actinomycetota bacterium]
MEKKWVNAKEWPDLVRALTDDGWWLADLCGVDRLNLGEGGYGEAEREGLGGAATDGQSEDAAGQSGASTPESGDDRFEVVAQFLHHERRERTSVHVLAAGDPPAVPSVTGLWPTADFMEREAFDLLGIVFEGHPNLKRIMLPDEWEGHPLRKDYGVGKIPIEFIPQPFLQFDSPHQQPSGLESGSPVDRLGQAEIAGGTSAGGLSHLDDTKERSSSDNEGQA